MNPKYYGTPCKKCGNTQRYKKGGKCVWCSCLKTKERVRAGWAPKYYRDMQKKAAQLKIKDEKKFKALMKAHCG